METMCVQQIDSHLLSLPRLMNNRMQQLRHQFLSRNRKNRQPLADIRQNLFGRSEKKHNLDFADQELTKMTQSLCHKWNFDIDAGEPMEGQYHWQLMQETKKALDTSGRLTCLTTSSPSAASKNINTSPQNGTSAFGFAMSSRNSITSSPSTSSSSSSSPSPNSKIAVTKTIFSTTTTPTAVIANKKCVKRLQKSASNGNSKVSKVLITDYFKEVKPSSAKCKGKEVIISEEKDTVSNRLVEILKIRSMNVR